MSFQFLESSTSNKLEQTKTFVKPQDIFSCLHVHGQISTSSDSNKPGYSPSCHKPWDRRHSSSNPAGFCTFILGPYCAVCVSRRGDIVAFQRAHTSSSQSRALLRSSCWLVSGELPGQSYTQTGASVQRGAGGRPVRLREYMSFIQLELLWA